MALTKADYEVWKHLREAGQIPTHPAVLEIGEANWWGDLNTEITPGLESIFNGSDPFVIAKEFYWIMLNYRSIVAVDLQGTPAALEFDLNDPLPLVGQFDIVINTGTLEHVFNQYQAFKSIHDACKVGGLMFHAAPWTGWVNHGLYNYQPRFFLMLAEANGYETLFHKIWDVNSGEITDVIVGTIPAESMIYTVYRKSNAQPFRVPIQRM